MKNTFFIDKTRTGLKKSAKTDKIGKRGGDSERPSENLENYCLLPFLNDYIKFWLNGSQIIKE